MPETVYFSATATMTQMMMQTQSSVTLRLILTFVDERVKFDKSTVNGKAAISIETSANIIDGMIKEGLK